MNPSYRQAIEQSIYPGAETRAPRPGTALWSLGLITLLLVAMTTRVIAAEPPDFSALVAEHGPAVVNITVTPKKSTRLSAHPGMPQQQQLPEFFERFFEHFPEQPNRPDRHYQGSGFIISPDGYVLTNAHVVNHAEEITIRLNDRSERRAELIGVDEQTDLALLKIDAAGLPAVRIGDSDSLEVGDWVLAIGAPFGFESTATQGIVSALSRSLPNGTYVPFIQTDVAVNPGNSGGPLFNENGEVVGINSQIYSRSGGYMGLSFAIPSNVAVRVVDQLKAHGFVRRGWLGVEIQDMNHLLAESFGLNKPAGALVAHVVPNSPAAAGGIKTGDVILSYGGRDITRSSDLPPLVGTTASGSTVEVEVLREGKPRMLSLNVGTLEETERLRLSHSSAGDTESPLGLTVANLDKRQQRALGVGDRGILVTEVQAGGPAAKAGLRDNDIILSFNHEDIRQAAQLSELVKDVPAGKPVVVLVLRNQRTQFIPIAVPGPVG